MRSGVVSDPASKARIEVDVVVFGPRRTDAPRKILSLGEARWGERMGHGHLDRLARARGLLAAKGYDTNVRASGGGADAGHLAQVDL